MKYSLTLWLVLSTHVYWPFKTSIPSQSEIFSVIVACSLSSCLFAIQDQHPLSKWNILCYCNLFSLLMCIGVSRPAPLTKWNILCYCSLFSQLVCIGLSRPPHSPKVKYSLWNEQATITENISQWEGVLVLNSQYTQAERTSYNNSRIFHCWRGWWSWNANTHKQREQATITENILLWEGVLVLNGQYTWRERTSYNNREYFSLGGCWFLKGQYTWAERTSYNNREYFTLGECVKVSKLLYCLFCLLVCRLPVSVNRHYII